MLGRVDFDPTDPNEAADTLVNGGFLAKYDPDGAFGRLAPRDLEARREAAQQARRVLELLDQDDGRSQAGTASRQGAITRSALRIARVAVERLSV